MKAAQQQYSFCSCFVVMWFLDIFQNEILHFGPHCLIFKLTRCLLRAKSTPPVFCVKLPRMQLVGDPNWSLVSSVSCKRKSWIYHSSLQRLQNHRASLSKRNWSNKTPSTVKIEKETHLFTGKRIVFLSLGSACELRHFFGESDRHPEWKRISGFLCRCFAMFLSAVRKLNFWFSEWPKITVVFYCLYFVCILSLEIK